MFTPPRDRLLTGTRRGEIFLIRAEHIGLDTIRLPASHTKTNRARVIPIIPALRPWLEHFPLTLTVEGMKSAWRRARVTAGMPHANFHDLRHSCASIFDTSWNTLCPKRQALA